MYVLLGCSAIALNLCAARLPAVAPGAATLLHAAHVPGRCHTSPRCSDRPLEAAPAASLYGAWPVWERPPVEYDTIVSTFVEVTTSVPLRASSEKGDGWREWADGGFAAHLLISRKLSRKTYISALQGLLELVVRIQQKYPDLYSVLKFVPKKNGLNPELAKLANGEEIQSLEDARPREVKRAVSDVQRAIEQSWLLLCCYLTLPSRQMREDMLWSARTVVEKIKTDQRSHALEMLCLAFFWRGSDEYRLLDHALWPPLKQSFESNFGANWHPKPTNARMVWQRCRMVYPFLEVAHRAWLSASSEDGVPEEWKRGSEDIAYMLDRIARAGPEEKVINSLLYWLLDAWFDVMLTGEKIPAWAPEPFILRREGVATRLSVEVANMGHLLDLVALCGETDEEGHCVITEKDVGDQMLLQVKQVETTATLLASIRNSCAEACPLVLQEYDALLRSSSLSLSQLQRVEFDALGALFELDGDTVANRSEEVLNTLFEWRNPELLFRYYEDNRGDDRLGPLIARWLRAIFKLSDETLDEIRRDSPASMKQMSHFPPEVLERWYAADCQGTSECKTLFMVGEDAGSCLRVISNEGNRYNRALMGYVLQPNCRVLVVTDSVGRVMARSLVRLLVRSDTREPIIFADPMFFTLGFSYELQAELLFQARLLQEHMQVPVVHSCSVLPSPQDPDHLPEGCYVREVRQLDYDVRWVDLLEMDGIAPYTYSEELPYDELLQQHHAGVLERTDEDRALAIAVLPRSDSPSAERYKKERQGLTGWTMVPKKLIDGAGNMWRSGAMKRAAARELIKGTRGDGAACGGCRGSGVGPAVMWRRLYTYN